MARADLRSWFSSVGEKPFHADQLMQWLYRHGVSEFDAMTNLSKSLRSRLGEEAVIRLPELVTEQTSTDGTRKWVLRMAGGNAVETVFIPDNGRGTLCISSQVGCALDCSFCSTAQQGFNRNLTAGEIIAQVWYAQRSLEHDGYQPGSENLRVGDQDARLISNVVFMGMGEPLANFAPVVTAIRILQDDFGFGLSKRRVTVSTSGIVPMIDRLNAEVETALAISLHAPDDQLRNELVPINNKYPIANLMDACRRYVDGQGRKIRILFEYVMLDQVNDSITMAKKLANLVQDIPCKVNLIPFNSFPGTQYQRSTDQRIDAFANHLRRSGVVTTVRRTRGDDIDAACGQLVGRVQSRQTNRLRQVVLPRLNS